MSTVIDELIIKIAFDLQQMKEEKRVEDTLKRIRDDAERTGKDMEASGKRAAQFFSAAKVEALALMSVLTGGAGLITAASATAASIADLGRAAVNLNGMNPQALDAWGMALKRVGGNAENAVASFNNIGSALARYRLRGDTAIIPFLNAIGAQSTMTPEQIALRFSEYIKAHPEKTAQEINVIGQGLGVTQDMINLLRQGPDAVRRELDLSRELGLRTQSMIETATKFQHDFEALNQAARHLTDKMMEQMMPTMDAFIVGLTKWITQNPSTAEATAIGSSLIGGAAGSSAIARMLGLTALADAFGAVTKVLLRFGAVLGLLSLTGPAGGQATQAETDATTERLRREGLLEHGPTGPLPPGYLDPNSGPSLWGWVKSKLGIGSASAAPAPSIGAGPRSGSFSGPRSDAAAKASFAFWKSKGLSDAQAAGMAAQEIAESGGNPGARGDYVNGEATAIGAYQWHSDRRARILAATGIDIATASIEQQREAAYWEYTHSEKGTQAAMQGVTDPAVAGRIGTGFERPRDRLGEEANRAAIAARIARLGSNAPPPVGYMGYTPGLLPGPGNRGEDGFQPLSPVSHSLDIGTMNIHTQAKDANGIAKEIHGAISDHMIQQANRGLA